MTFTDLVNEVDNLIRSRLNPLKLEIIDESQPHSMRTDVKNTNNIPTHLLIIVESTKFKGLTLLEQHRLIYDCFEGHDSLMPHALRIKTICPNSK